MILTEVGKDIITIDDNNYLKGSKNKIHIINLNFKYPNVDKMENVLNLFPKTNRFIVHDNVKFYNRFLRNINKKYYVTNNIGDGLVTFFKRNNKVVLNVNNLNDVEFDLLLNHESLLDILSNLEVIIVPVEFYDEMVLSFKN